MFKLFKSLFGDKKMSVDQERAQTTFDAEKETARLFEEKAKKNEEEMAKWKEECATLETKYIAEMRTAIAEIDEAAKSVESKEDKKRLLKAVQRWRRPVNPEKFYIYHCYHTFPREPYGPRVLSFPQEYSPDYKSEFWELTNVLMKKASEADKKLSDSYGPVAKNFKLMSDEENSDGSFRETIFFQRRENGTLQKHVTTVTQNGVSTFGMNVVFIK